VLWGCGRDGLAGCGERAGAGWPAWGALKFARNCVSVLNKLWTGAEGATSEAKICEQDAIVRVANPKGHGATSARLQPYERLGA